MPHPSTGSEFPDSDRLRLNTPPSNLILRYQIINSPPKKSVPTLPLVSLHLADLSIRHPAYHQDIPPSMNGLQSVSISLGKRIRCLPLCPPGTRGRILSRRLSQIASRKFLDGPAVTALFIETIESLDRLKALLLKHGPQPYREGVLQAPVMTSPSEPLDPTITGLTSIPIPPPKTPMGLFLRAVDAGDGRTVYKKLKQLEVNRQISGVRPHQLSAALHGELKERLSYMIGLMRKTGHPFSTRDAQHILEISRHSGGATLTRKWWQILLKMGIPMDTWAYNVFMAAQCGASLRISREIRVTPDTVQYHAKRPNGNVRSWALQILGNMQTKGLIPSSMTFENVIFATSRLSDLPSVDKILLDVWGIDVNNILNSQESGTETEPAKPILQPDSPLWPTQHTLLAVTSAYCKNGQVVTAIRILDHFSRLYSLPISEPVWVVLLNWSYVYTRIRKYYKTWRTRTDTDLASGAAFANAGLLENSITPEHPEGLNIRLHPSTVEKVWNLMTSPPYEVTPTLEMWDYIIRSFLWRSMPTKAEQSIDTAISQLLAEYTAEAQEIETKLSGTEEMHSEAVKKLKKRVAELVRKEERLRAAVRRWTEILVLGKQATSQEFAQRDVPRILEKFEGFMGETQVVRYVMKSGVVELQLKEEAGEQEVKIKDIRNRVAWKRLPLGHGVKEEDYF
ncbi:mitochondrial ATPase expression-domain-containing protein [Pyronema domesticum]|nr:mitochondrial ATPase expression-domain-containing protein [Pyronema domesticum]